MSTNARFSQSTKVQKDRAIWYDDGCKAKKSTLKEKIRLYNDNKNAENRAAVFRARKDYKYFL